MFIEGIHFTQYSLRLTEASMSEYWVTVYTVTLNCDTDKIKLLYSVEWEKRAFKKRNFNGFQWNPFILPLKKRRQFCLNKNLEFEALLKNSNKQLTLRPTKKELAATKMVENSHVIDSSIREDARQRCIKITELMMFWLFACWPPGKISVELEFGSQPNAPWEYHRRFWRKNHNRPRFDDNCWLHFFLSLLNNGHWTMNNMLWSWAMSIPFT